MGKESVYDRYPSNAKERKKAIEWSQKVHGPRGKPVEYGYGRDPKTGRLNWRFRKFGNSPANLLIEKGRDKLGLRSIFNPNKGVKTASAKREQFNRIGEKAFNRILKEVNVLEKKSLNPQAPSNKGAWVGTKGANLPNPTQKALFKKEQARMSNNLGHPKVPTDFQTAGKQSLLTNQTTRSKGGGKSAGGGGGKYGIINRALGGRSPWHHLKRLLE